MAFYTSEELAGLGFKRLGKDVKISRAAVFYHPSRIEIGDHVRIDDFVSMSACQNGFIRIGSHVHVAAYVMVEAPHGVVLDDFAGLAVRCTVLGASDDYGGDYLTGPTVATRFRRETGSAVRVGRHVVVGASSVLLPGTAIGDGSAVGAMTLVRGELEPGGIYVGIPARRIGNRSPRVFDLERELTAEGD
jgi:galactoside O-acetyltransferase